MHRREAKYRTAFALAPLSMKSPDCSEMVWDNSELFIFEDDETRMLLRIEGSEQIM